MNQNMGVSNVSNAPKAPDDKPNVIIERLMHTQLCKHHLRGHCHKGATCAYAHSEDQLKPRPDLVKTKLCRFTFRGGCHNPNCTYAHGMEELRHDARGPASRMEAQLRNIPSAPNARMPPPNLQDFPPHTRPTNHASQPAFGHMLGPNSDKGFPDQANYPPIGPQGPQSNWIRPIRQPDQQAPNGYPPNNRSSDGYCYFDGPQKKSSLGMALDAFSLPADNHKASGPKQVADFRPTYQQFSGKEESSDPDAYRLLHQMITAILEIQDENECLYSNYKDPQPVNSTQPLLPL